MLRELKCLKQAVQRRSYLAKSGQQAYRLFHGFTEAQNCGLSVDRYAEAIYIRQASKRFDSEVWVQAAKRLWATKAIVYLDLAQGAKQGALLQGQSPGQFVVAEDQRRFVVDIEQNRNTGLFLDARPARDWVQAHSQDRHVLDLFSYTGAFSVAAMHGGASSVELVDNNARVLNRAKANLELNGFEPSPRQFQKQDIYQCLKNYKRQGRKFAGIVFDPPPAFRSKKKQFKSQRDYFRLLNQCLALTTENGWLLALCTDRKVVQRQFLEGIEKLLKEQGKQARLQFIFKGLDFPHGANEVGIRGASLEFY